MLFRATSRQTHFYPRSPCGERPKSANTLPAVTLFLSTLSLRRATYTAICLAPPILFLSTISLRRATSTTGILGFNPFNFYPRSPCGERLVVDGHRVHITRFLSTLSLRRATSLVLLERLVIWYFYPRSPCGERRYGTSLDCNRVYFSIHALLAESDSSAVRLGSYSSVLFYPRSPCGERRKPRALKSRRMVFSIHALLAESDID